MKTAFVPLARGMAILTMVLAIPLCSHAASGLWSDHAAATYDGGDGSAGDPFQIGTAGQMALLAANANAEPNYSLGQHFVLTADIDLAAHYWVPVGEFKGSFDGQGNKVLNLTIDSSGESYRGLFGRINSGAEIANLGIINCDIVCYQSSGALAGSVSTATVSNCYSTGMINGYGDNGGLIGDVGASGVFSLSSSWSSCAMTARVASDRARTGGLVGPIWTGTTTIHNCHATGAVNGYENCGGLVALNYQATVTISNCYSTGDVTTPKTNWNNVGGIMGLAGSSSNTTITNCYAAGVITGSDSSGKTGGIIGGCDGGGVRTVTNSYYNSANAAGEGGGTATSIAAMQELGFVGTLNGAQDPAPWLADVHNGNHGLPILDGMPGLSFTARTDMPLDTLVESNAVAVDFLIVTPVGIIITGGEYAVSTDGGSIWGDWTDEAGNVALDDHVKVRLISAATPSTTVTATLTIGGVDGTFSVTTKAQHTVVFRTDSTPGATVNGAATVTQLVLDGGGCTGVLAAAPLGYHHTGWTGGYVGPENPLTVTNVTANLTITANFAINTYTVTFDLAGRGTRDGGGELVQSVNHGSAATAPTVLANPGLTFSGWDKTFDNVTSDLTVTAQYNIDLTTNSATGGGDMTQARYLVNLGIAGGHSVTNYLSESGLYDYSKYRGNNGNNWSLINNGSTSDVLNTYGDVNQGGSTPPPDYFGYKFKYPVLLNKIVYSDYCYGDGGTFNGTPSLQYLSALDGTWTTVDATWNTPYNSSFAGGRRITYTITPDVPLDNIWAVRLHGDTTPSGAWDSSGWACVTELQVYGTPNFGSAIYFDSNLAQTGTPICSNGAWKPAQDGSELTDGNFDNSNEVWDTGNPSGDKFVGMTWATPQDHIGAIGFGMTFNADGGWFVDTVGNPLKVQYTTDGTTWHDAANLNKGRYTADYPIAAALGYSYKGSWLFTFDSASGVVGIRLIGLPGGSVVELGGNGYISIREMQVFEAFDIAPDAFVFLDQTGVDLSTVTTSNTITVAGINGSAGISIDSCTGTDGQYQINGGAWTSDAGTVNDGDTVTVRQTSSASYSTQTDLVLDIGGVTDTFSVTTLNSYTLTYIPGSNGTIAGTTPQTIEHGSDGTEVTAVPDANCQFVKWSDDVMTAARTDTNITADLTVTATFAINTYTVTFDLDGKGERIGGGALSQVVEHGAAATAPDVEPDAGWHFTGWSVAFDNITGPLTVTAQYLPTYLLTYAAGPNGLVNGAAQVTQVVAHGADGSSVEAQPGVGHHFTTWSDGILTAARQDTGVTGPITVTASFAINTYTVTFDLDGKGERIGGGALSQVVEHGAAATAPEVAGDPGWEFTGWDVPFDNIVGPLTVTALYHVDQVACGSTFVLEAADVVGIDRFRQQPKAYTTYRLNGKPGKAAVKLLEKADRAEGSPTLAGEWTKRLRLYDLKAFRASEAGGVGAAEWITATTMADLIMDLRVVSKEVADQSVQPLALAVPVIADIADGGKDIKDHDLLVITGTWFGTKKPKVWREYTVPGKTEGTFIVKRQAMKVVKPTEADAILGFKDSKQKPAHMNAETGASKVIVIIPAKEPKGVRNGTIVIDNGVGLATGGVAVGDAPAVD
jgi:hypothetical protein